MDQFMISGPVWFDGVNDPVLWVKENRIAYCNPAAADLGLEVGQLLPMEFRAENEEKLFSAHWKKVRWTCRTEQMGDGVLLQFAKLRSVSMSLERVNQLVGTMQVPLGNLYSAIQMLETPSVGANEKKVQMYQAIRRKNYYMLHRMMENVETLCWLEDEATALQMQLLDVSGLCKEVVTEVETLFEQAGCTLAFEQKDSTLLVQGNEWAMRHMLYELLANALRSVTHPGRVWVKVARDGHRARITVGHSGEGFSSEELACAFDVSKGVDGMAPGKGLGMGVSICRLIVERLGGRIALLSGKGGTVMIDLPLCEYVDGGQLHSIAIDHSGGWNSALVQLSHALPWECFLGEDS